MRKIYSLITTLLQVPLAGFWFCRGLINKSYREGFGQRFGFGYPAMQGCIWVHAVSVGEVQAAAPLIRALQERFPQYSILVTTVTPTGAARVRGLFGDSVTHCYIPFEAPYAVDRFFNAVRPKLALIMETEIWPNLYQGCGIREIPLVLVSARISPKSLSGYQRFLPLFRETLSHGIIIAAQSQADADRFQQLGASSVRTWVIGNIKFDIEIPEGLAEKGQALRESLFPNRPIWIAASTHDNEEQEILDAHRRLLETHPDLLLILVPRHPERFKDVAKRIKQYKFTATRRTEGQPCAADVEVFLADTMGELPMFYAASDIAFVGGSLVPVGGHNMLEPASLGLPVISGPQVFNAQEIADLFVRQGACRMVEDAGQVADVVGEWVDDPSAARDVGERGRSIVEENRGSLASLLDLLEPLIGSPRR